MLKRHTRPRVLPIELQLATVLLRPFAHEPQCSRWKLASDQVAVANCDPRLELAIARVELSYPEPRAASTSRSRSCPLAARGAQMSTTDPSAAPAETMNTAG